MSGIEGERMTFNDYIKAKRNEETWFRKYRKAADTYGWRSPQADRCMSAVVHYSNFE